MVKCMIIFLTLHPMHAHRTQQYVQGCRHSWYIGGGGGWGQQMHAMCEHDFKQIAILLCINIQFETINCGNKVGGGWP